MLSDDQGNNQIPLDPNGNNLSSQEIPDLDFFDQNNSNKKSEEELDTVGVGLHFHEKLRNGNKE